MPDGPGREGRGAAASRFAEGPANDGPAGGLAREGGE